VRHNLVVHADQRGVATLIRARLTAQLLSGAQPNTTEQVLERLLAVQAQDLRGARLAIRSRSTVASVADVDALLTDRRGAVITWLNRGTLHLVTAEDYWWLHPLTTPQLWSGNARRLHQEGLTPTAVERGIEIVADAVHRHGPRTRSELKSVLDSAGVRTEGQALVHLLFGASLRGLVVRGPLRNGESAYVEVTDWLGPAPPPLEESHALARLARRYLAGHGPAGPEDLAKWAGVTLGRARLGLHALTDEVVVDDDGRYDLVDRSSPAGPPKPTLLGAFDPVLHGWVDRAPLVGSHRAVVTTNGVFRATALVGGRVVGIWGLSDGQVRLRLLETISRSAERSLAGDARAVQAFLGLPEGRMVVTVADGARP
jgi:Winged helix DNA-binding domain